MKLFISFLTPIQKFNDIFGWVGSRVSAMALALMVVVILLQVFFRYVMNNALPWPDEAARFLMLWLTGLMAPIALRQGGFVAIETISRFLPNRMMSLLTMFLLIISLAVLCVAVQLGWKHVNSGWLFASASLTLPLHLIGMTAVKLKLAWMYSSLFVGSALMLIVTIELILRQFITLFGHKHLLRPLIVIESEDYA